MNNYLSEFNLTIDMLDKLAQYFDLLVEKNKVMNLTAITKLEDVYIKHFYDSLLLTKCTTNYDGLIDVGSGAGFPGIPLAVVNQSFEITLLEPTTKRANFLNECKEKLNLKNVNVINDRAENIKKTYECATARAVSQLNILLELITPLLKVGGKFYCLKGSSYQEELENANNAMKVLNMELETIQHFTLPLEMGERVILVFKKTKANSSKYPRRYATILKQPL